MLGQAHQWRLTLLYGLAHYGKSLFWYASEILFAYFLTEIAGLPVAQMGTVLVIGFLASAGIDVTIGLGLQRWLTTASVAARIQQLGAVASSVALVAVFMVAEVAPDMRFAYAVFSGIGFRLAFAVFDIPQNALMALATSDRRGRLRVASTRIWFSGVATLTVAASVGPIVANSDGDEAVVVLEILSGAFALVAITSAALLTRALRAPRRCDPGVSEVAINRRPPRAFWLLIGLSLLTTIFTPAFSKLEPYFAHYTLQSPWWGSVIAITMALGILLGQPLWLHLSARSDGAQVLIRAAWLQIAALAVFWLAAPHMPAVVVMAALAFGLGNGGVGMVQWYLFSDVVAKHLPGRAGVAYGVFVASNKIGLALGGALIAGALGVTNFRGFDSAVLATLMTLVPGFGAVLLLLNGIALLNATRSGRRSDDGKALYI